MTEEEKAVIKTFKENYGLTNAERKIILSLIQEQDKIIKNQSYTNKKMKKKLDNYRKLTKFKERKIGKKDTEINKLKDVIDRMAEYMYKELDFAYSEEMVIEYFMKEDK